MESNVRKIKLYKAIIVILFLIGSLFYGLIYLRPEGEIFGLDPHMPILISAIFAAIIAKTDGMKWQEIENSCIKTISTSLQAILILMIIGSLIAAWISGGIVPAMIFYGLKLINPVIFLPLVCVICAIISISTGSSWTTAGTVGVAFMGIGSGLGFLPAMTAGAVISGAYFGDKLSPLSDTTNLAPAVAGAKLFEHIRYMLYTTVPSMIIALIIYTFLSLGKSGNQNLSEVNEITSILQANFNITPILLLAPVAVIALVVFKIPAIPGLIAGTGIGVLFTAIFQSGGSIIKDFMYSVFNTLQYGYSIDTGSERVNELLNRGGLNGMMWTVSLILLAMTLGGILEGSGILYALIQPLKSITKTVGGLVTVTVFTSIFTNITTGDQYLSIVLPGRMYKKEYEKLNLAPELLSRTLEDSGTLTSPLVPYNTCGATMYISLGVSPLAYLPYAYLNIMNPIIAIIYAVFNIKIRKRVNYIEGEENNT